MSLAPKQPSGETPSGDRPFWALDDADIAALVFSAETGPAVPAAYAQGVEENLGVLRAHARILAAALAATGAGPAPGEAFEP